MRRQQRRCPAGPKQTTPTSQLVTSLAGIFSFAAVQLVVSIVIARRLGPEGRGIVTAAVLLPTLLASAFDLGGETSGAYFAARAKAEPERFNRYRSYGRVSGFTSAVVALPVAWAVGSTTGLPWWFSPVVVAGAFTLIKVRSPSGSLLGTGSLTAYGALRAGVPVFQLIVALALPGLTPLKASLAWLGSLVIWAVAANVLASRALLAQPEVKVVPAAMSVRRSILDIQVPAICLILLLRFDQLVVLHTQGLAVLGLYAVATNLGEVGQYVSGAALPLLTRAAATGITDQRRLVKLALAAQAIVNVALALVATQVIRLIYGPAFTAAGPLAVILLLASLPLGLLRMSLAVAAGHGGTQRTRRGLIAAVSFALPAYGLAGRFGDARALAATSAAVYVVGLALCGMRRIGA